jgi:phosphoglycolate phosphatase
MANPVGQQMIDGVIFDKDGTLFDFRHSWAPWVRRVLTALAPDEAAALGMAQVLGFDPEMGHFAPGSIVIAATVEDSAREILPYLPGRDLAELTDQLNDWSMEVALSETVPLVPFLRGLKARGLKIGLATNDTEAPARAHLAGFGIEPLFDFIAGYDSGFGGKPDPGMLLAFLRQTGLQAGRVAMVGDSLHDLASGRAAGMRTVAVLTGVAGARDLAPFADVVLDDIGGIPRWLDSLTAP